MPVSDRQTRMLLFVTATNRHKTQQGDVEQQSADAVSNCTQNTRLRLFCSTDSSQRHELCDANMCLQMTLYFM